MFVSTTTNGIDAKGRVSVPADFRATVSGQGFAGIYVWRSPFNGPFLEGGGQRLLEDYSRRHRRHGSLRPGAHRA
jgi:MraZ protein